MNFSKKNYILSKKLSTFLFLCFTIILFSQNPPTVATFKQQDIQYWQDALQLIQPQITTGILYNKVSPFCNLYTFNTTEYNTANSKLFKQALSELHRASDNQSQFISIDDLKNFKEQVYFANNNPAIPIVEIGVINTYFNFLFYNEENENDGGLNYINGVYTPIVGKTTVFEKHVSLISPQKEFIIASTNGTVSFRINNTIYFNNGKSIKTLNTNFGSNGSFSLVTNEVVNTNLHNVTYASFGEKLIEFTITYTDNSTLTTFAKIRVINREASQNIPPPNGCSKTNIVPYTSTTPYQAWDEQSAMNGKMEYKIFFGNNNQSGNCDLSRVKKPFILIDGFDPGDKRRIEVVDCINDPICQELNKNVEGVFEPNDYKSLYRLMKYGNNPNDNLVFNLQEENYDVIIINLPTERAPWDDNEILHDFGADYIQRNAMTLTSFIKEVNTSLADNNSAEELVIVGPSMGGQITRYALAYMEKQEQTTGDNSWHHNTRLWISVDSPHQGANIPLAIQGSIYFLGFINGDDEAKKQYEESLRSPAAKQMLIDHYDYFTTSTKSPYFLNYQADLAANGISSSNGYPTQSRNISIINGSLTGVKNAQPAQRYLDMRGYIDLSWWFFDWRINFLTIKNNYQQEINQTGMVFDIRAYRLDWNFYNSLIAYRTNTNWQGSMDAVPGGYFNTGNDLKEVLVAKLAENNLDIQMYVPSTESDLVVPHAFISTHSALDTSGFSDWYQPIDKNIVCTNQTPFDSYYGETNNTEHVSFTQASKDWLFEELAGNPQPPTVYLDANDLNGPDVVCNNDIVTYDFGFCDIGSHVVTWEVSNSLQFITSDGHSITVEGNSTSGSSGYIRAIFLDQTVQKNIWVGRPDAPTSLNGPELVNSGSWYTYSGGGSDGATSYNWILPYPFDPDYDIVDPVDQSSDNWQMLPNNTGWNSGIWSGNGGHSGYVQLEAVNSCGEGGSLYIYVEHDNSGGSCTSCDALPPDPIPNSADENFKLDFTSYPEGTYYIYIYDQFSNLMYQGQTTNIDKTVETTNIPNGLYYLHIHDINGVTMKQLFIQH